MSNYYVRRNNDYLEHSVLSNVRSGAHKYIAKLNVGGKVRYIYNAAQLAAARAGGAISNVRRKAENAIGITARNEAERLRKRNYRLGSYIEKKRGGNSNNYNPNDKSAQAINREIARTGIRTLKAYDRYNKTPLGRAENLANRARTTVGEAASKAARAGKSFAGSVTKEAYRVGKSATKAGKKFAGSVGKSASRTASKIANRAGDVVGNISSKARKVTNDTKRKIADKSGVTAKKAYKQAERVYKSNTSNKWNPYDREHSTHGKARQKDAMERAKKLYQKTPLARVEAANKRVFESTPSAYQDWTRKNRAANKKKKTARRIAKQNRQG